MRPNFKTLTKAFTLIICFLTLLNFGCKKEKDTIADPSLVGNWSNVTQTSTYGYKVIYLSFKADGTGREALMTTVGSTSNDVYDDEFKWSASGNSLNIQFPDAQEEHYTFSFNEDKEELSITSEAGDVQVYLKNRD